MSVGRLAVLSSLLAACAGSNSLTAPAPVELIAFGECDAGGRSQIFVAAPDGSQKRQLTRGDEHSWFPAFSLDGGQILFTREIQQRPQVWVMDSDGGNQRRLVSDGISLAGVGPRTGP